MSTAATPNGASEQPNRSDGPADPGHTTRADLGGGSTAADAGRRDSEEPATERRRRVTSAEDVLVDVTGLKVHFPIKRGAIVDRTIGYVYAVDGIDMQIRRGETYGLVGESGCGKSTFGRALLQLEEATAGRVEFDGTDVASLKGEALRKRRQDMQMVFQDPLSSLDPRQSIESLLLEGMQAHGLVKDRQAVGTRLRELLTAVGLPTTALKKYPHEFSGGQRQRIGIARALSVNPKLIVADEPVSALDVSVQAQVINLLEDLQHEFGLTYLVVAHDLAVVRHISDVVGVMYLGALVEEADADDLYAEPLHPYTRALMSAVPVPDPTVEDRRERVILAGDLPSPANPPAGCRFHTRCPWRQETRCDTERPELRVITRTAAGARQAAPAAEVRDHKVACHWAEQIADGTLQPHEIAPTGGERLYEAGAPVGVTGTFTGPASVTEVT